MSKTVKEYKMQVCDLSYVETIQDVIDNCEKAFGLDFDFLKYENIECIESLQTAYLKGNEFSIDGAYGHENYRTKIEIETTEQKEVIYHNENSGWYLINDNYKDAETIEEEEIDLTQYKIVKIESSECDIDYGFDDFNGVAKCYTWEGQDGVWYLEEKGCFTRFNSCEELENFMNSGN